MRISRSGSFNFNKRSNNHSASVLNELRPWERSRIWSVGASYRGSSRSISFQRIWRRRICRLENVIRGPSQGGERLLQDDRSETVPRKCLSILHVHSQSSADLPRRRWERLITIESIERVYAQCCSNPNWMQRDYRLGVVPTSAAMCFGVSRLGLEAQMSLSCLA